MTNSNVKQYADELSDVMIEIEAQKLKASGIVEAAKEAGICPKNLRKIAKELIMDSSKLAAKYEAEEQLELFRSAIQIRKRKGLEGSDQRMAAE